MTWALLISLFAKSSLVAGAGLACARYAARRPVDRVDILRATVCLVLALPVIMALAPGIDLAVLPPLVVETSPVAGLIAQGAAPIPAPVAPAWPISLSMLGGVWLLGAALIVGQLLLGLRTLRRWTQAGHPVTCPDWRAPIERLPPGQRPRLVSSARISGPLSWGLAPGAIVVDPATLIERQAAPAIMAHELAHLRRRDWLFLILSRMALALFWFNPLVWRLHAALAERSEEAADAAALRSVDRTLYARTLVRLAASPVAAGAATAMAADARTLKTRIACIMTNTSDRRRPLTLGLTVVAMAAIATPLAALGFSHQEAPPVPPVPPTPVAAIAPPAPPAPPSELAAPPAPPEPPAPPAKYRGLRIYSSYRAPTAAEIAAADAARDEAEQARIQADQARVIAADARRQAEEVRRDADARRAEADVARRFADEGRRQAEAGRRMADQQRVQADIARAQAEGARIAGEQARKAGELARQAGERARIDAAKQMVQARAQMAAGAVQMRQGARDMREEAGRLHDPAYRAKQIEESRARGDDVTDAQLRALADRLPTQADRMERQADRLAARAQNPS